MGTSTAETVRRILAEDAFIREPLLRGVIGYSKLARWIQAEYELDGEEHTEASITSALQRYEKDHETESISDAKDVLAGSNVNVNNELAAIVVPRTSAIRGRICELYDELNFARGEEALKIVPGKRMVLLMIREEMLAEAKELLGPGSLERTFDDITTLQVSPSDDREDGDAIWAIISTLRARGVHPTFFLSSYPDHYVVVPRDVGDAAYESLSALSDEE